MLEKIHAWLIHKLIGKRYVAYNIHIKNGGLFIPDGTKNALIGTIKVER